MTQMYKNVENICKRFVRWMRAHNYTQQIAAETLQISRSHLNKVINGKTNPSIYLLEKMEQLMEE